MCGALDHSSGIYTAFAFGSFALRLFVSAAQPHCSCEEVLESQSETSTIRIKAYSRRAAAMLARKCDHAALVMRICTYVAPNLAKTICWCHRFCLIHLLPLRCFAAAEEDVHRAIELSKDKNDPALQRLLKSITKARAKLAVATADYMSPPLPLGSAGGVLSGDVPSYYSLNVSGVGGAGPSAGAVGMRSGGDAVAGHAPSLVDRRSDQPQLMLPHQYHVHQQQHRPASPQVSQESLGSSASLGAESASGFGMGSASSRSSEILQVTMFETLSCDSFRMPSPPLPNCVPFRSCIHRHCMGDRAPGALLPLLSPRIKEDRMPRAAGECDQVTSGPRDYEASFISVILFEPFEMACCLPWCSCCLFQRRSLCDCSAGAFRYGAADLGFNRAVL